MQTQSSFLPLRRRGSRLARVFAFAPLLGSALGAQSIQSIVPEVADPGDTIRILGADLASVDSVRFTALVGGFVGSWTINVPPGSASANELRVEVPLFNNFTPPDAVPPGQLVGSVRVASGAQLSNTLPFGYLESTFGAVSTQGTGGSAPAGFSARIGFALPGGLPQAGNAGFTARVDALPPTGIVRLGIGVPASAPFTPLFGGELRLDPALPFFIVPPSPSVPPFGGSAAAALPVPASAAGITVALQWVSLDPQSGQAAISDALIAKL